MNMPFPAAAPSGDPTPKRGLVVGGFAECCLFNTTTVLANLFEWSVKPVFDYSNLTAHGDPWQVNQFLDAGWTAQAKGYLTLLGATYLASGSGLTAAKIPNLVIFNGYSTLASATGGSNPFLLFAGSCGVKDFELMVPEALLVQTITLIGTGTPGTIS